MVRVEHVGSLVRPPWLEGAVLRRAQGRLAAEQLGALQDRAVREAIDRQAAAGLELVTDGELRRMPLLASSSKGPDSWQRGWASHLVPETHDESLYLTEAGRPDMPRRITSGTVLATDQSRVAATSATDEYRFAAEQTARPVKVSLLGPERAAQGLASVIDRTLYAEFDALVGEVVRVERAIITELAAAGCTHVQLDVPGYAAYEDPISWAALRGKGLDPLLDLQLSVQADNAVTEGISGITFGIHVCRRGLQGRWQAAVRNDAVAEMMMSQLAFDRFLLDYGTDDVDFAHLRFVPPATEVVLGLVSTTDERVETSDELVRRIEEATAYIDEDQLAIGPQCGFAGPVGHRDVSEDSQWRKLEALVDAAERVWG